MNTSPQRLGREAKNLADYNKASTNTAYVPASAMAYVPATAALAYVPVRSDHVVIPQRSECASVPTGAPQTDVVSSVSVTRSDEMTKNDGDAVTNASPSKTKRLKIVSSLTACSYGGMTLTPFKGFPSKPCPHGSNSHDDASPTGWWTPVLQHVSYLSLEL